MQNPFVYGEVVPAASFVDRIDKLDRLVRDLASGQKVFLISPRRYGKSSLVRQALRAVARGGAQTTEVTVSSYSSYLAFLEGYTRSLVDPLLMRSADVLLSFPALLFLLVLVTGAGTSTAVVVLGVAVIQMPLIARIILSATLVQSVRGFVEAAVARGERTTAILRRELLPNILAPIMADVGLRFTYSIILVASVNFLGLGLQPPGGLDAGLELRPLHSRARNRACEEFLNPPCY